jgi:hypothetical protein
MSEYDRYDNQPVLTKFQDLLPELLSRNMNQGKSLKDKIQVNSFFEKREKKAWKNVMGIIDLSQNRRLSFKNGNYLKDILSRSINEIEKMSNKILDDKLYSHVSEFNKEKKLLKENAGIENIKRVKKILTTLNKKPNVNENNSTINHNIKSLSQNDLSIAKSIIDTKILNEQKKFQKSIISYQKQLNYLKNTTKPNRKIYNEYSLPNLNLLTYSKYIEPEFKEDKETTNLRKIKKYIINKEQFKPKKRLLKKSSSVEYLMRNQSIYPQGTFGIFPLNKDDFSDTVQLLNKEVLNNFFLPIKLDNHIQKIDSLIITKLPNLNDYDKILINKIKNEHLRKKSIKIKEKTKREEENKKELNFEKTCSPIVEDLKNFIKEQPNIFRNHIEEITKNNNDDEDISEISLIPKLGIKNKIKTTKTNSSSVDIYNKSKISNNDISEGKVYYKKKLPYSFLIRNVKSILQKKIENEE